MNLNKLKTKSNILYAVIAVIATALSSTNFYFAVRYLCAMINENYYNFRRHID